MRGVHRIVSVFLAAAGLAACSGTGAPYPPFPVEGGRLPSALEMRQLTGSQTARGRLQFEKVWLADPTSRYPNPTFGSATHAESLLAISRFGETFQVTLPHNAVFEDIEPRVVDLDRDALEEILVVESDRERGPSLAVYGTPMGQKKLVKLAATPYLGQPSSWLHPIGAGDFDGDTRADIAVVEAPDIGGSLVLYRYGSGRLDEFARYFGVSTHRRGSTELGASRVVHGKFRAHLLIPDQSFRTLQLLTWRPTGIQRLREWKLPAGIVRIDPLRGGTVDVVMTNGQSTRIQLPDLE